MHSLFDNAMSQFDSVIDIKQYDEELVDMLRQPDRGIQASIPVKMDNGTLRFFDSYRVQYCNLLGPYKGGLRFHHETDIEEVKALAFWMTMKSAVIDIPMGGGKGGVTVNPKLLSKTELERLSRAWMKSFSDILGPHKDVPAPDVNTTPEIMAWMADEYAKITKDKTGAVITGKPVDKGGSLGRDTATAQGGFYAFEELREDLKIGCSCKVSIQGFGNAGSNAALIWYKAGHKIIAVSDSSGGVYNKSGLDIDKLIEHKNKTGSVQCFSGGENISNEEVLEADCDLLIPAALENAVNEDNAHRIKATAILELANGPLDNKADEMMHKSNITVIPDILANAGGVAVSCFEWEQNLKNERWTKEKVMTKLNDKMSKAARRAYDRSREYKTTLRNGAFLSALDRIQDKFSHTK